MMNHLGLRGLVERGNIINGGRLLFFSAARFLYGSQVAAKSPETAFDRTIFNCAARRLAHVFDRCLGVGHK